MGDDHRAARELEQRVLEGGQGLHVEVVGGLVEEQQVAALLEGQGQVQAVALTAGEHAGLLLLVRALEAERGHVGARGHLDVADLDVVQAVRDDLPQRLLGVDVGAGLVHVRDLHGLADLQLAAVQGLEADDGLEQGGLADAVRADHADDAVAGQGEGQAVDEDAVPEALLQVLGLDHDGAQARARRDLDLLEVQLAGLLGLGRHLLVAGQAGLGLRLTALRVGADPVELLGQALGELGVLLALHLEAGALGLQVGGVVALVRVEAAAVDLRDPLRDVVEEVPVVGDGDDGARVGGQVLLEPQHGLGVQVVGGLVEQEEVRLLQQQLAQRDAALLATGEVCDRLVPRGRAQGVHRLLELGVDVPRVRGVDGGLQLAHLLHEGVEVRVRVRHLLGDLVVALDLAVDLADALLDVLEHGLGLVQLGLLHQDAHRVAGREPRLAVRGLVQPGHDLQDRRLAGAVGADHADLRPGVERHGDVVQDQFVAHLLAGLDHRVDEFRHAAQASRWPRDSTHRADPATTEPAPPPCRPVVRRRRPPPARARGRPRPTRPGRARPGRRHPGTRPAGPR